jgi:nucleoside-diphosphate-sugar epimerase
MECGNDQGWGVVINGDGKTGRDFCFIENAMQANRPSTMAPESSRNEVYNVAVSDITSRNQLFGYLKSILKKSISYSGGRSCIAISGGAMSCIRKRK